MEAYVFEFHGLDSVLVKISIRTFFSTVHNAWKCCDTAGTREMLWHGSDADIANTGIGLFSTFIDVGKHLKEYIRNKIKFERCYCTFTSK